MRHTYNLIRSAISKTLSDLLGPDTLGKINNGIGNIVLDFAGFGNYIGLPEKWSESMIKAVMSGQAGNSFGKWGQAYDWLRRDQTKDLVAAAEKTLFKDVDKYYYNDDIFGDGTNSYLARKNYTLVYDKMANDEWIAVNHKAMLDKENPNRKNEKIAKKLDEVWNEGRVWSRNAQPNSTMSSSSSVFSTPSGSPNASMFNTSSSSSDVIAVSSPSDSLSSISVESDTGENNTGGPESSFTKDRRKEMVGKTGLINYGFPSPEFIGKAAESKPRQKWVQNWKGDWVRQKYDFDRSITEESDSEGVYPAVTSKAKKTKSSASSISRRKMKLLPVSKSSSAKTSSSAESSDSAYFAEGVSNSPAKKGRKRTYVTSIPKDRRTNVYTVEL
jgi:hypothetical protein